MPPPPLTPTLFPYTTLFRSSEAVASCLLWHQLQRDLESCAGTSAGESFRDPQCCLEACLAQAGRCGSNSPTYRPHTPPDATRLPGLCPHRCHRLRGSLRSVPRKLGVQDRLSGRFVRRVPKL